MYTFIAKYNIDVGTATFTSSDFSSDYSETHFYISNIHVTSSNSSFQMQVNATGETGFNETMTNNTSYFAYNTEDTPGSDGGPGLGGGQHSGTGFAILTEANLNTDTDSSNNGVIKFYNPTETTHFKVWSAQLSTTSNSAKAVVAISHGVIDTASYKAIESVQLKCSAGNMDSGSILVYGVS